MNKDINKLLKKLEPEIDKKCSQIKVKKINKKKQIIYMLLLVVFITLPSLLIIFNLNITYFAISTIIVLLLTIFMKLPDLLNSNIGGICCE